MTGVIQMSCFLVLKTWIGAGAFTFDALNPGL
jgi:hypothetical protein